MNSQNQNSNDKGKRINACKIFHGFKLLFIVYVTELTACHKKICSLLVTYLLLQRFFYENNFKEYAMFQN